MMALSPLLNGSPSNIAATPGFSPNQSAQGKTADRMEKAGTDFEAVLLTQWLQSAEKSFATVPTDGDDTDDASDQMKEVGMQAVAQQLSRSDMLGIAHMVTAALRHSAASAYDEKQGSSPASAP